MESWPFNEAGGTWPRPLKPIFGKVHTGTRDVRKSKKKVKLGLLEVLVLEAQRHYILTNSMK